MAPTVALRAAGGKCFSCPRDLDGAAGHRAWRAALTKDRADLVRAPWWNVRNGKDVG